MNDGLAFKITTLIASDINVEYVEYMDVEKYIFRGKKSCWVSVLFRH